MPGEQGPGRLGKAARFASKYGYAAASTLYLFSLGVRDPRHRSLIGEISAHFGHTDRRSKVIQRIELSALVSDDEQIQLRQPLGVDGNVSLYELVVLCKLVRHFSPSRIFEIGTFDGRTTLNFAANAGESARVFTLDLPRSGLDSTGLSVEPSERVFAEKEASGSRFRGTDCSPRITQLYGDSATFDFSEYESTIDLVFVDGSHAYPYVKNDSDVALRLLSPRGGVVIWHDYGVWDGVTVALNELNRERHASEPLRRVADTSLVLMDSRQTE